MFFTFLSAIIEIKGGGKLNKVLVTELLEKFRTVTGMDVSVLNADFHTVASTKGEVSKLCGYVHKAHSSRDICRASDIERLFEVKEIGHAVTYTCPLGITEAIAPIIRGDTTVAYLIATIGIKDTDLSDVEGLILGAVKGLDKDLLHEKIHLTRTLTEEEIEAHLELLKMLGEHIARDPSIGGESESIGTMIKYYIKNNLGDRVTLADIANSLHCSTVTLTEHFKAEFEITVMDYLLKKRMELSERLMLETDLPLREIAARTGFADVEYFSRTFKKCHSVSPAAWRRSKMTSGNQ